MHGIRCPPHHSQLHQLESFEVEHDVGASLLKDADLNSEVSFFKLGVGVGHYP
jgi:hypothetical protein